MRIAADTHVHLYPFYSIARALEAGRRNLSAFGAEAKILMLTERVDCHVFEDLRSGRIHVEGWKINATKEPEAIEAANTDGDRLYIIAGRQIVTEERIEALALATTASFREGRHIESVLEEVRAANGIPALAWAPGKWFFERGRIVRKLLEKAAPGTLVVGDTSLRPPLWGEPGLFRLAAARGLKIADGSDPLPFGGEEERVGMCGILADGTFDRTHPASAMRWILSDPSVKIARRGAHSTVIEMLARLKKNCASIHRLR